MTNIHRRQLIIAAASTIGLSGICPVFAKDLLETNDRPPRSFVELSEQLLAMKVDDMQLASAYWNLLVLKYQAVPEAHRILKTLKKSPIQIKSPDDVMESILRDILNLWLCSSSNLPETFIAKGYLQAMVWRVLELSPPSVPYSGKFDQAGR